jgi:hypothetical protein
MLNLSFDAGYLNTSVLVIYHPMASYSCVTKCGQSFRSERGLSRHQDACRIAGDVWTCDLQEAARNREKAKRQKLDITQWVETENTMQAPVGGFVVLLSHEY